MIVKQRMKSEFLELYKQQHSEIMSGLSHDSRYITDDIKDSVAKIS